MSVSVGATENTRQLLSLPSAEAVAQMLARANAVLIPVGSVEVSDPTALADRLTEVELTPRQPVSGLDEQVIEGSPVTFQYKRLPLDLHFGSVMQDAVFTLPTTTQVILNELTRRTGQQFSDNDIVQEWIGEAHGPSYQLKAKSTSLRWMGSMSIALIAEESPEFNAPPGTFVYQAGLSNDDTKTRVGIGIVADDDSIDFLASADLPGAPVARRPGLWLYDIKRLATITTTDQHTEDLISTAGLRLLRYDGTEYLQPTALWQSTPAVGTQYLDLLQYDTTTLLVLTADDLGTYDRLYAVRVVNETTLETIASIDLGINGLYTRGNMVLHRGEIVVMRREEGVPFLHAIRFNGTAFEQRAVSQPMPLRFGLPPSYLVEDGDYIYTEHRSVYELTSEGFNLRLLGDSSEGFGPLAVVSRVDQYPLRATLIQLGYNNFKLADYLQGDAPEIIGRQMQSVMSSAVSFGFYNFGSTASPSYKLLVLSPSVSSLSGVYHWDRDADQSTPGALVKVNNIHLPGHSLLPGCSVAFLTPFLPFEETIPVLLDGLNYPDEAPVVALSGLDYPDEAPVVALSGLDYP